MNGEEFRSLRDAIKDANATDKDAPPVACLLAGIATARERRARYGDSYTRYGAAMEVMFPEGLTIRGSEAFARLGVFTQALGKLIRYAEGLSRGGHADSAHDLMVYAAILESLTTETKEASE